MFSRAQVATLSGPPLPEVVLSNADAAEQWVMSLPAPVREDVQRALRNMFLSLPGAEQIRLADQLRAAGHSLPFQAPLAGISMSWNRGLAGGMNKAGSPCTCGLGQWGALVTGLAQAGASIYGSERQIDLQKSLAKQAGKDAITAAAHQNDTALRVQQILADAQIRAAELAAQSSVAKASISAPLWGKALLLGGIGVLLFSGGFLALKLRKK